MIISFSITSKLAKEKGVDDPLLTGTKTVTRRLWKQSTAEKYQRIFKNQEVVYAWDNAPYVLGSKQIATIILTHQPYQEKLGDMPENDLLAEGGLWGTKDEFIRCVCKGKPNPDLVVWVCRFKVVNIIRTL
ncbi:hypothetical protein NG798_27365 [Ancylothrix sp. C2]|uniref:hypothetical protein n=1 Tax=Ancylothrix sp. D3o TaxID=2953691 RepID=UPI0021BB964B|nr:hypothetical protein [Ancylothrix sp. D3o]MCT7953520.1 hypothetical protein [Ancylothrix sp. D3o]